MDRRKHILLTCAQYIKGVGPERFKLLLRLKINTVEDLLYYFPRRHEDRSRFSPISSIKEGNIETIRAEVIAFGERKTYRKGLQIFQLVASDGTGRISCVWFNQPYMKRYFKVGQKVIFHGKAERFGKELQMNSPEYEIISQIDEDSLHMGRIVPIYPLTQDLTQRSFRSIVRNCLNRSIPYLNDTLPYQIKSHQKLTNLAFALKNIHFPKDFSHLEMARRRLVFDEFFLLQLALFLRRQKAKSKKGIAHKVKGELVQRFRQQLSFQLTPAQEKVISEIERDMASSRPMGRLLQGEVGSGKTVVATFALLITVQSGFQGALMVPTEILAEQHYANLAKVLEPLGVDVALLTSSITKRRRQRILKGITTGEVDIIIGTHALIQEELKFKNLGLVVIDEQHKFGVFQRASLSQKRGDCLEVVWPDCLVMTATPIPRSLALSMYGDLDISTIRELPPGRKAIKTYWFREENRDDIYRFIEKRVNEGRQVYIVYPLIEQTRKEADIRAAKRMYEKLKDELFPQLNVGLAHGRMNPGQRSEVMERFKEGKLDILVSTIVIEVGIDIPNASVMLIEHAERFGLSQLHQLRGRIGRGDYDSYCILVSSPKTEEATRRLEIMVKTQDGFRIAQEDLKLRGPGEFFGTRQHGFPELKIGDLLKDRDCLRQAREEAWGLLRSDPKLIQPKNFSLREVLKTRYGDRFALSL